MKFSVLMSVYCKEKAENLKEALFSIYQAQTLKPDEIVLVEDGKLTKELYEVIENFKRSHKEIFKIISLEKNMGLGKALNIGVKSCKYEYIARMDSDDISSPTRFERQISTLEKYKEIDVLGTNIKEFSDDVNNVICIRKVPTKNFYYYIKYRCPFNHPTVIFKKSKVIQAGNYQELLFNEDIYLWVRMLKKGCKFSNLDEELLYFRVTEDTYKRRGGWKYIKSEWILQKIMFEIRWINCFEFFFNIVGKGTVRLLPNSIRKFIYLKLLRNNQEKQ